MNYNWYLPEHHLDIIAELEVNLEDVNRRLPMENVFAAELRHQRAYQEGHADVRVLAQVRQNILQKSSVVEPEPELEPET